MRIFKREQSEFWWAEFYDLDGKRIRRSTQKRDKTAALEVLRKWERESVDPRGAAAKETTLEEVLTNLLRERTAQVGAGKRSSQTVTFYRYKAGVWVSLLGRDYRVAALSAVEIDKFIEQRREHGASENTIAKELVTLRSALRLAKRRLLWFGDLDAIFPPRFSPEYKPRERYLTQQELLLLLPLLRADHAARVTFSVATSANLSETERVLRTDLNTERAVIRGTKTAHRARVVPLVLPWQKAMAEYALRWSQGEAPLLFGQSRASFQKALRRACELAGIPHTSPNDLRRTCATWLRAEGAPVDLLAPVMGHADGKMVERVYGRLSPADLAARLSAAVGIESRNDCTISVPNAWDAAGQMGRMGRVERIEDLPKPHQGERVSARKVRRNWV